MTGESPRRRVHRLPQSTSFRNVVDRASIAGWATVGQSHCAGGWRRAPASPPRALSGRQPVGLPPLSPPSEERQGASSLPLAHVRARAARTISAISASCSAVWTIAETGTCSARAALELGLLVEPVVEHVTREADVPSYSMARQATSPHGLIDPARLDVEIPSGLLRAQESILRQRGRWVCR